MQLPAVTIARSSSRNSTIRAGVELLRSYRRLANLPPMDKVQPQSDVTQVICGVLRQRLDHWRKFIDLIAMEHRNAPAFIYRGQARDWPLLSSLDRLETQAGNKRDFTRQPSEQFDCPVASREQHLQAFKDAARGRFPAELRGESDDEWWALARHHGLATPVLDWTVYPFMALYFAFEESHVLFGGNLIAPQTRFVYRASWHLIQDLGAAPGDSPRVFIPRLTGSHRVVAQGAVCVAMPCAKWPDHTDLESYVRKRYADENGPARTRRSRAVLEVIEIPSLEREDCLKLLNKMGINRMTMYPDLDGAAAFVNSLWELDFDTAFGAISLKADNTR